MFCCFFSLPFVASVSAGLRKSFISSSLLLLGRPTGLIRCNPYHGSISLVPGTLWLAIPAAIDLVFMPAFLRQPAPETSSPTIFYKRNAPTSHADMVLSPTFSTFFHDTPSFPLPVSTAHLTAGFLLLPVGVC